MRRLAAGFTRALAGAAMVGATTATVVAGHTVTAPMSTAAAAAGTSR